MQRSPGRHPGRRVPRRRTLFNKRGDPSAVRSKMTGVKLPPRPTPLVGRDAELNAVRQRLLRDGGRLLTLTGSPGVGKTRLALEVAAQLRADFEHGVVFVDLTSIDDDGLVVDVIAQALGIRESPETSLTARVVDRLRDRHLLLLLDNFEHLVNAAPAVAELLSECPRLGVLATSRIPLRLRWEYEFPLAPLALPHPDQLDALDALRACPSVALFVERARAVKPDFVLDAQNATAVAELCARMDGLPLAIELAAAQVKLLPMQELLNRLLRHRFNLLTARHRDLPPRHQTLRSAIAWSYDLLHPGEQALFRRLAIFVGGWTQEAAEAICGLALPREVGDGLAALIDKSLVHQEQQADGRVRFHLLESLREYGLEQLDSNGERDQMERRHALFFLTLAQRAEPELHGHQQSVWLDQLEQEHANLRSSLQWFTAGGDPAAGLGLAGALLWFWDTRGHWSEGRQWLAKALDVTPHAPPPLRAKALSAAGHLAFHQDDMEPARALLLESAALFREGGDLRGLAEALDFLATVHRVESDYDLAAAVHGESLALFRQLGDAWGITQSLSNLGFVEILQGNYDRATQLLEQSLAMARELGRQREAAIAIYALGIVARHQGDGKRASRLLEESLALFRHLGAKMFIAYALHNLGILAGMRKDYGQAAGLHADALLLFREIGDTVGGAAAQAGLGTVALHRKQYARATAALQQSLAAFRKAGSKFSIAPCLESLAALESLKGQPQRAARWFGAAEALRASIRSPMGHSDRAAYERHVALARARLREDSFEAAWAAGRSMPLTEVIDEALSIDAPAGIESTQSEELSGPLTRRQMEVAALVARGLSNREIARRLFISERTAGTHVQHILNKLGFKSRAQIAAWAVGQGLSH